MANDTFWTLLNSVVDKYLPKEVRRYQAESIKNDMSYAGRDSYKDLGYRPDRYGMNVTSQPGNYLHDNKYLGGSTKPKADSTLPYHVGGDTDAWGNIRLNPDSSMKYDELTVLLHEMEHRRRNQDMRLRITGNKDVIQERPTPKEQKTLDSILERFKSFSKSPKSSREGPPITGQEGTEELLAQLKSYEALLPAGMTLLQSPVGQKLFPDNDSKLWWLQQSRSDIGGMYTDQDYLQGLEKTQQGKK